MSTSTQSPPKNAQRTGTQKRTGSQKQNRSARQRIIPLVTGSNQTMMTSGASTRYGYTQRVWQKTSHDAQPKVVPPGHRQAILQRKLARRVPWKVAAGTTAFAALSWGMHELWTSTLHTGHYVVPAVCAGLPLVTFGVLLPLTSKQRIGRFTPDWAAATLAAAGLTVWTGLTGPSWAIAAVAFLALVCCSARWWLAHPVGPRTASIAPPPATPTPKPKRVSAVETTPTDTYAADWDRYVASKHANLLPGSHIVRRTPAEEDTTVVTYRVELARGQRFDELSAAVGKIASALMLPRQSVRVRPSGQAEAESIAYMELLTTDPVSDTRFYTGPTVEIDKDGGRITGLARFVDGQGELSVTMWNKGGCRSVGVTGGQGTGKSASTNALITAGMSTGRFNLCYIDPKGNSSVALPERARLSFLGREATLRAPELLHALAEARGTYSRQVGKSKLLPAEDEPGWIVVHDELSEIKNDTKTLQQWGSLAQQARSRGFWQIGINQVLTATEWGNITVRDAFTHQVLAFRIKPDSDTVPMGLTYRPSELPVGDDGQPVAGWSTNLGTNRNDIPALWDALPSDDDAEEDPDLAEVAYTESSAFDTFFRTPELLPCDRAVLEAVLGPPDEQGRWIVGDGTHTMPEPEELKKLLGKTPHGTRAGRSSAAPSTNGALGLGGPTANGSDDDTDGAADDAAEDSLTPTQREVLALVRGGTTRVGAIAEAAAAARSSVERALPQLVALDLLVNTGRGEYEPA